MVCLGNICRSPMAAAVARAELETAGLAGKITVRSYGTAGYHAGEGCDPGAEAALRRRGWPVTGHVARQITAADIRAADLVLCADTRNLRAVRRLAVDPGDEAKVTLLRSFSPAGGGPGDMDVPDPWGGGDADFDATLAVIEEAVGGLVAQLAAGAR
jgi:protein-tyrosine phosphatase